MAPTSRVLIAIAIASTLPACESGPEPAIDAAVIDAPAIDAPLDAPAIDAAVIDAPIIDAAVDAPALDAPIDAPPIDAVDAVPIDGAPIDPLPPLVLDSTYSDDGSFRFGGQGYPGAIAAAGPRLGMCGVGTHWFDDITYYDSLVMYRATPGASEDLYGTATPLPISGPVSCPGAALFPDGRGVSAFRYWSGRVQLIRRDAAGTLLPAQDPPQTGEVRALVATPGDRVAVLFDDAVWLLDDQLAPVTSFGTGGRVGFPGPFRHARVPELAVARLDIVTDGAVRRLDLATGALDPSFGAGGVATLPGPFTFRGVAPRPGGAALIVGVGNGLQLSPSGAVTIVTLPFIDPRAVVADGAGGAYLIAHPVSYAVAMTITQIAPNGPTSWGAGTTQTIAPPDLCPIAVTPGCTEWFRVAGAARTVDGRLGVYLELRTRFLTDFFQGHVPQLLVLAPG